MSLDNFNVNKYLDNLNPTKSLDNFNVTKLLNPKQSNRRPFVHWVILSLTKEVSIHSLVTHTTKSFIISTRSNSLRNGTKTITSDKVFLTNNFRLRPFKRSLRMIWWGQTRRRSATLRSGSGWKNLQRIKGRELRNFSYYIRLPSWAVVVVKWSACSPSTPTFQVRIPLKPTVISIKLCVEKNKNKQKEAGFGPLLDKTALSWFMPFMCSFHNIMTNAFSI